ncbi:MAG TPA: hypothetical protein VFV64_02105 [Permianibacter sp.]|nr:hypothetical protein [Permianibacter sp.]
MTALIISLISLGLAPWLYGLLHRWRRLHDILDRLLVGVIVLIVLIEVFVEGYEQIGWVGPLLGLVAMALPSLIEQVFSRLALPTHSLTALLGALALAVHSLMDGATLAAAGADQWLAAAVVLHQLPLGLAIWWLVRHALGRTMSVITLIGMGLATIVGFVLTQQVVPALSHTTAAGLQAFLAGALLHVLIHRHRPHHHHDEDGHAHGQDLDHHHEHGHHHDHGHKPHHDHQHGHQHSDHQHDPKR